MNERILWPYRIAAWAAQNARGLAIGGIAAAALVGIMLVLRGIGRRVTEADPHCRTWRSVIGHVFAKTGILFMIIAALDVVANYTVPPPKIAHPLDILFTIAASIQAAVWMRELIMGLVTRGAGEEVGETALSNAGAVIRVLVSVALFAVAALLILDNLGVNVTALVAGLGIGGIAIGLAAQGIFADLFAALAILFDKPFVRGDTIGFGDSVGTVERIGLKTTRLRSTTGEQLVMANTKLLDQQIHNYAEGPTRRTNINFGVIYQTTPETLETIPDIAKAAVDGRTGCSFLRCVMTEFAASSLNYELWYDCNSIDANVVAAHRAAIMLELIRQFAKAKVEFAYPTQTTFTAAPDGTVIMPYPAAAAAPGNG